MAARRTRKSPRRAGARATARKQSQTRYWSQRVTRESNALDLEKKVLAQKSPVKIAASLKRSAERSRRRKASPYRSAMSMLTFYINRAGKNLPAGRKAVLKRAKQALRHAFGRA